MINVKQLWLMVLSVCVTAIVVAVIANPPGVTIQKIPLDSSVEAWALDWGKAACVLLDNHKILEEGHGHGKVPYHFICSNN